MGSGPKRLLESQLGRSLSQVEVYELSEVPEAEVAAEQAKAAAAASVEALVTAIKLRDKDKAKAILHTERPDLCLRDNVGNTALYFAEELLFSAPN